MINGYEEFSIDRGNKVANQHIFLEFQIASYNFHRFKKVIRLEGKNVVYYYISISVSSNNMVGIFITNTMRIADTCALYGIIMVFSNNNKTISKPHCKTN